jgi:NAD(P)H-dependent nitrite reductase small subunit
MGQFVPVAKVSQLKEREGVQVQAGGEEIALFRLEDRVCAISNVCPHRGGSLADGSLDGTVVTCPWHGWEFDVRTGAMPVNPNIGVRAFDVRIEGDDVLVDLAHEAARAEG